MPHGLCQSPCRSAPTTRTHLSFFVFAFRRLRLRGPGESEKGEMSTHHTSGVDAGADDPQDLPPVCVPGLESKLQSQRPWMHIVLSLALFWFCGGCAQKPKDRLVVGMELNYPPFEMVDLQGQPTGVSV